MNVEHLKNRGYRPVAYWYEKQSQMCLDERQGQVAKAS
jgi:hypothetical protein